MFDAIRFWVTVVISFAVLLAAAWAFIDAVTRPDRAFVLAMVRGSKKVWLLALAVGWLFAVLGAFQMVSIVLTILAVGPAAAYWYGIRPDLLPYGRTGRSGRSGRSGRTGARR